MKRYLGIMLLLGLFSSALSASTYYVNNSTGNDTWDGTAATYQSGTIGPKATIQAGINVSVNGDTVIVADGTYTGTGNRDIDYGTKAITVKSVNGPSNCIIDSQGSLAEPHRAFIFQFGIGTDSVLSGFTITGGYVTSAWGNIGGGIFCNGSTPTITNCIFRDNYSEGNGAGLAILSSGLGNFAISGCTFINNIADGGGAISLNGDSITVRDCILWDNISADPNLSIYTYSCTRCGPPGIQVDYSILQDYLNYSGTGNSGSDPLFGDPNNDDYHLQSQAGRWNPLSQTWVTDAATSPGIDAGDPSSDWTDELWPHGKRRNMGAYGGTSQASMSTNSAVGNVADFNCDGKVDIQDFGQQGSKWLVDMNLLAEDTNRNGTVDTDDLFDVVENWMWME